MEQPIYAAVYRGVSDVLHLSLDPHSAHSSMTVNGVEHTAETFLLRTVSLPDGARKVRDKSESDVAFDLHGRPFLADAEHLLAFAENGLHGFALA